MKIDWSKAPEGATHYCAAQEFDGVEYGAHWLKPGHYCLPGHGCWLKDSSRVPDGALVCRPLDPWNGTGLPPVGAVCDFMWNYRREGSEYVQARVLLHDEGSAIVRIVDGDNGGVLRESRGGDCGEHPIFRPIRTPEQIAEEARNTAIMEMLSGVNVGKSWSCAELAGMIYDAGYRKTGATE